MAEGEGRGALREQFQRRRRGAQQICTAAVGIDTETVAMETVAVDIGVDLDARLGIRKGIRRGIRRGMDDIEGPILCINIGIGIDIGIRMNNSLRSGRSACRRNGGGGGGQGRRS